MPNPLDHADDCGCQVCNNHRERLETDQRAREIDASAEDVDRYQPDPTDDWQDPEPAAEEPEQRVVIEHRYETVEHHEHTTKTTKADTKDLERRTKRLERKVKRRRRGGKVGLLRTLCIGAVLVWIVQSFYPEVGGDQLDPIIPGACTDPGATVPVFGFPSYPSQPPGSNVPDGGWGSPIPEVPSVEEMAKDLIVNAAGGALNAAGETVRAMADHAPTAEGIREGLINDVTLIGKGVGFVVGALSGKSVDELVPDEDTSTISAAGCSCLTSGTASAGSGATMTARAALAAGWTGEDAVTAVAIAGAESDYNPKAANSSSTARGLWQTMMSYHEPKYNGASWSDPMANARVAHMIWQDARGWSPWTTYTSGSYRAYLDEARTAVAQAQGSDATPVAATTSVKMAGLQPVAQRAADYVRATFGVNDIGGYATSGHVPGSKHYEGLAIDVMTYEDTALGQRIADYFAGPGYEAFGVDNVIFNHRIYNAGRGWHEYPDRGNPTLNHEDHPHIDFHEGGGTGATPAAETCVAPTASTGGHRVATFNILGARHTPGSWRQRWPGVPALLNGHGVSVAGLQEVHPEQRPALNAMPGWETFGDWDAVMAWRTDTWRLEDARYVNVPMYPGRMRKQPLVKLSNAAGESVWFLNVHNSRNNWARAQAFEKEVDVVRQLDGPVVWLGDTNDRGFVRQVTRLGLRTAGTPSIDQIAGAGVTFSGSTRLPKTGVVAKTSDHTLVYTDLTIGKRL